MITLHRSILMLILWATVFGAAVAPILADPAVGKSTEQPSVESRWAVANAQGDAITRSSDRREAARSMVTRWREGDASDLSFRAELGWRLGEIERYLPPAPKAMQGLTQIDESQYQVYRFNPVQHSTSDVIRGFKADGRKPVLIELEPGVYRGGPMGTWLWSPHPDHPLVIRCRKGIATLGLNLVNGTNYLVQNVELRFGCLMDSVPNDPMMITDKMAPKGVCRRWEGCLFEGGIQLRGQGPAELNRAEFFRCRLTHGGQGILAILIPGFNGKPGLLIDECLIGDAGDSPTHDHAMYITGCRGAMVRRSIIVGASGSAAKIDHSHDVTIKDCLIARCNSAASPNANTLSAAGDETRNFVFEGNVVTEMNLGQATFWWGWSLNGGRVADNLFVNAVSPGGNGAIYKFSGPFEGDKGATPMRDVVIEDNLSWNFSGSITIDTDFNRRPSGQPWSGIVFRNNVQGMPPGQYPDWAPKGNVAVWTSKFWTAEQRAAALKGITIEANNVWVDMLHDTEPVPGVVKDIEVVDPTMNIAKLNKALGGAEDPREFYAATVRTLPPNEIIDAALKMFRSAYQVKQ